MLQRWLVASAVAMFAFPQSSDAQVAGKWNTSEGTMTLVQQGIQVTGRYTNDNGEIVGAVRDNVLTGYWIEDGSSQRCATPRNGRYYWGQIRFVFAAERFTGQWSYCDAAPGSSWTGTRIGGAAPPTPAPQPPPHSAPPAPPAPSPADGAVIAGKWNTSEGTMTLVQQGAAVSGRYTNDNGEIVGTVGNNVLTGYWIEDSSGHRCTTPRNGRYYWGQIRFVFTAASFTGQWGYCETAPSSGWTGTRIAGQ